MTSEMLTTEETSFIDALAAGTPTPGGGGAAAYVGALGSALSSMVGNLTAAGKKVIDDPEEFSACLADLEDVRAELLDLVEGDARAFAPLAAAFRLPRGTEEEAARRKATIQEALVGAIEAPIAIMKACARVIDLSDYMAHHGSRMAVPDVATGVSFAKGALKGAALNVFVNAKMLDDRGRAKRYTDEAECLILEYGHRADDIYTYVLEELR